MHIQRHTEKNPIFTNQKKIFEHIELPAKLLDYFLRNNKSNINQRGDRVSRNVGDFESWVRPPWLALEETPGQ